MVREMFRKKEKSPAGDEFLPVPAVLPPAKGLEEEEKQALKKSPRVWLWSLVAALAVVFLLAYVLVLGGLGVYDGLKDRTLENRQIAREHYELGLAHLEAKDYELAVAEFELALRHDAGLREARSRLLEAKELARSQVTPTSETRRDAAELLYRQAVAHYEGGTLVQAVAVLEELRGLDADFERENVGTMLVTAHYQLGLNAVRQDRMDDAADHFEAVLALDPEHKEAQDELNLLNLYTAALSNWDEDWSATIQALKGLYALAPDYKDVQMRLHDAYTLRADEYVADGDWCRAAEEYAAAVEVLPREATVDRRDDARIQCQATAEAPTATATPRATARPTSRPTGEAAGDATATPQATPTSLGEGQIAFPSYDAARQRYDIFVVDLAQGSARLLRENAGQPAFAPNGNRLAFHNHDPMHLGLGVVNLRTNEQRDLTDHVEDTAPTWSPAGSQIVFASNKHGDRKWRIYAVSAEARRADGEEWAFGRMPAWSPQDDLIAYQGCDERGDNCGLWLMKAGGFEPARLTTDPSDTAPAWSPDGAQIAFVSARAGNWELYLADVATGEETRLTNEPAVDVAPTWSPDGTRIAFLSSRGGGWAVYVLEITSGAVQKIIATGDPYLDPVSQKLSWVP